MDMLVKINVHWQSPTGDGHPRNRRQGAEELKVDEYDNREIRMATRGGRDRRERSPNGGVEGIPYVVQIEDDLRQKSEQVTGARRPPPDSPARAR